MAISLARQTLWLALSAVALLALSELIGFAVSRIQWPTIALWSVSVDLDSAWNPIKLVALPIDPEQYNSLAATAVQVEATFLALFYATLGVVASTAYNAVPGDIRLLFVESRVGSVYTRGIVRAFVFTSALMTLAMLGCQARILTLAFAIILAVIAALRLVVVGTEPFRFFDPAALTETLPDKVIHALRTSTRRPTANDEGSQRRAHGEAVTALEHYRRITDLVTSQSVQNSDAPLRVAQQLLALNKIYAGVKDLIPSESRWFGRIASYPNWFTMPASALQLAVATSTGSQADAVADHLWFERQTTSDIGQLLNSTDGIRLSAFTEFIDAATAHVRRLAGLMQVDEAILLEAQLEQSIWAAVEATPEEDASEAFMRQRDRVVASQRSVLLLINLWLGVVDAAQSIRKADLEASIDRAISAKQRLEGVPTPRDLLRLLEQFNERLASERAIEGRVITPAWWIHHHVARSLAGSLVTACQTVSTRFDEQSMSRVDSAIEQGDWEVAAMTAFAILELVSKVQNLTREVREALTVLGNHESAAIAEPNWPSFPEDPLIDPALRMIALEKLGTCLPHLDASPHMSTRLDLFGQAYTFLFEGAFEAILEGADDAAATLFSAIFAAHIRASSRTLNDLVDHIMQARIAHALDPLVGLMELSGYAILVQELDGNGIWDRIRVLWDDERAAKGSTFIPGLAKALDIIDNTMLITNGAMARHSRQHRLARLLEERGVVPEDRGYWPSRRAKPQDESRNVSAMVQAFATDGYGPRRRAEDLFLVTYVKPLLAEGMPLSRSAESLALRIERDRKESGDA